MKGELVKPSLKRVIKRRWRPTLSHQTQLSHRIVRTVTPIGTVHYRRLRASQSQI